MNFALLQRSLAQQGINIELKQLPTMVNTVLAFLQSSVTATENKIKTEAVVCEKLNLPDWHTYPDLLIFKPELPFTYSTPEPDSRRAMIKTELGLTSESSQFPELTDDLLKNLFPLYDKWFFGDMISKILTRIGYRSEFSFSDRLTSAAGNCAVQNKVIQLKLSRSVILKVTPSQPQTSNGLIVKTRLDAVMNVFEHELIHLLHYIFGIHESHGPLFREMALKLFGHTDIKHEIADVQMPLNSPLKPAFPPFSPGIRESITPASKVPAFAFPPSSAGTYPQETFLTFDEGPFKITKDILKIGDIVSFKMKEGIVKGRVEKLNPKRAKVVTEGGVYNVPYELMI